MAGYDSKPSNFGSRKLRPSNKPNKKEQKRITDRDNKRGLTKAQSQAQGLTGDAKRKAAAKLAADRAKQKTAVAAEAKRKAAEKKKTDKVDTAATIISSTVGGMGIGLAKQKAKIAAEKAARAAKLKEINADLLKIKDYPRRGKVRGMPQRALDTPAGKARHYKQLEEVRKKYLNKGGMVKAYSGGGAVKKKSVDGIAMRGKTKATRSR